MDVTINHINQKQYKTMKNKKFKEFADGIWEVFGPQSKADSVVARLYCKAQKLNWTPTLYKRRYRICGITFTHQS